ncbi:MAG: hypothetical protein O2963_00135 [Proteobacteria bacterium]|nr:hypothetical protein [Pseudomonadota bacterium]
MAQALQVEMLAAGLKDTSGRDLSGGYVKFFESDGTTAKNVYNDSEKAATTTLNSSGGVDLDDNGEAIVFADGVYVIKSYTINSVLVKTYSSFQYNPNDPATSSWIDASLYGSTSNSERISLAISDAAGADKTVYLPPANYDVDVNLTVPSNINLRFEMGAYFTVVSGITATINGSIDAPLYQIFRGTGTTVIENRNFFQPSVWASGTHDNATFDGVQTFSDQILAQGTGAVPIHIQKEEPGVSVELLRLDRTSATPADNDSSSIFFYSENDNNEQEDFAEIECISLDVSDGTEKGQLVFSVADGVDGSMDETFSSSVTIPMQITKNDDGVATELLRLNRTSATPADNDSSSIFFYSENDNNQQEDYAEIKCISLDVSDGTEKGQLVFSVADGVDGSMVDTFSSSYTIPLQATKNDDGVTTELLRLNRTSATPADNDSSSIFFYSENDNNEQEDFAEIRQVSLDVSDGTEEGQLVFAVADGVTGALVDVAEFGPGKFIHGSTTTGITAGTTQTYAGATQLTAAFNSVDTCANNNDGVRMPEARAGRTCSLHHSDTLNDKTLKIYPFDGDDIGEGVDTALSIRSDAYIQFLALDATTWIVAGFNHPWKTWSPSYSANGGTWTSITTSYARYKYLDPHTVKLELKATGTAGSTPDTLSFTPPVNPVNTDVSFSNFALMTGGAERSGSAKWDGSTNIDCIHTHNTDWNDGANSGINVSGVYEV